MRVQTNRSYESRWAASAVSRLIATTPAAPAPRFGPSEETSELAEQAHPAQGGDKRPLA